MEPLSEHLQRLGEAVSDVAERRIDPGELPAARKRWMESPVSGGAGAPSPLSRRPGPGAARRWMALAAACLALLFTALALRSPGGRISFVFGAPPARGAVGEWVAAGPGGSLPLRFSEGTRVTLAPGARARVTATTDRGATILLERGSVTAQVQHRGPETRWSLDAGPFRVAVTGTVFEATWDPTDETFTVLMREGTVVVSGPLLQAGRELHAGERLRVSVRDGSMEVRSALASPAAIGSHPQAPPDPAPVPGPTACAAEPATPAPIPSVAPARPKAETPAAEPGWRDLAAQGKFKEALAAAQRAGFAGEIERASSADLATLADAARYAGRPALAREALLAQRRRFGTRGASAFMLGKIAADQQGGADAVRWFETYLVEAPHGPLAEQALGRILELSKRDPAVSRATAERYLARYPRGVYAALARSLLPP